MNELILWGLSIMTAVFAPIIIGLIILSMLYINELCEKYTHIQYSGAYLIGIIFGAIFAHSLFKHLISF